MAAGGLVWSNNAAGVRIAIVHRVKHDDWALPKGKPEPDELPQDTAVREVKEELGCPVALQSFAGSYSYLVAGGPKVVLMWHMVSLPGTVDGFPDRNEIDRVLWVAPEDAIKHLTHSVERNFVSAHCLGVADRNFLQRTRSESKLDRLAAALQRVRGEHASLVARTPGVDGAWWSVAAGESLDQCEAAFRDGNLDLGWGGVHNAERFLIFGLNDAELIARAIALQVETTAKLGGWRLQAATSLFATLRLAERDGDDGGELSATDRLQCQHVLVEALSVLHGHGDNTYHRLHLVEDRLGFLVKACGALLVGVIGVAWLLGERAGSLTPQNLFFVGLAGALGGVASAMYQLSRVGEARIPEALLNDLITKGRPLVGAASAIFIYVVMVSGIISLIDPSKVTLLSGVALGFVAGFSEQFVLKTVARVAGAGESSSGPRVSKMPSSLTSHLPAGAGGTGSPAKPKPMAGGEAGGKDAAKE